LTQRKRGAPTQTSPAYLRKRLVAVRAPLSSNLFANLVLAGLRCRLRVMRTKCILRTLQAATVQAVPKYEPRECWFYDFGDRLLPYEPVHRWQQQLRAIRLGRSSEAPATTLRFPDAFMLLTHTPVYTLGTAASPGDLGSALQEASCAVVRTERGGKVTYHGPGQVTGYAIMNLRRYRCDLRWYVSLLEEVVIRCLRDFGIPGERRSDHHGVWVAGGTRKIAFIGVSVSRWVTCHGFALNVNREVLPPFRRIVACGLDGNTVTCMQDLLPHPNTCSTEQVRNSLATHFSELFDVALKPYAPSAASGTDSRSGT